MATHNLFAVSANAKETAINTEQTLDTSMLIALEETMKLTGRRETNEDEASGYEEKTEAYDLGWLAAGDISFKRGQSQHFGFLMAFALGSCVSTQNVGSTGYTHTITPIAGDLDSNRSNPTFTAAQRYGKILKRRFASCFVKNFKVNLAKDSWATISASIGATGKYVDNILEIDITAATNATTMDLAVGTTDYAIAGATAAERLANIDSIIAETASGVWTDVTALTASTATPCAVTFTAPGTGTENITYKVQFIPDEEAWATFPAKVSEDPLRVTDFQIIIGGKYNGTAISGGHTVSSEIKNLTWDFSNDGLEAEYVPGGTGTYANRALRQARNQKITINRDFLDFRMQQRLIDNDNFTIKAIAEGAAFDGSSQYTVEIIWPACRLVNPDIGVDGKRLGETIEVAVLEDATYGSVVAKVINAVSAYAA